MKNKLKSENLFVYSVLLYLFTTTTYRLWPSFFPINKFSGVIIIFALLLNIIKKVKKSDLLNYFVIFTTSILCSFFASDFSLHLNDLIYWVTTLLLLIKLNDEDFRNGLYLCMKEKTKLIRNVLIICNAIIIIGLFVPSCYVSTWNDTYFIGFGVASHAFSCGICLLLALTFILFGEEKGSIKQMLWFIPGIIGIFFSGARTYLVPLGLFLLIYYMFYLKKVSIKIIAIPIALMLILFILSKSNMIDKFINATSNSFSSNNSAVAFSNGRFDFWKIDMEAFGNYNLINKFLGKGFDHVYYINQRFYKLKIWAHNDLIDCLLSIGIFGTVEYLLVLLSNLKILTNKYKKWVKSIFFLYVWFVLLVNGMFIYQHYLYSIIIFFTILTCNPIFKREEDVYA